MCGSMRTAACSFFWQSSALGVHVSGYVRAFLMIIALSVDVSECVRAFFMMKSLSVRVG